jgi:hypothetical protein
MKLRIIAAFLLLVGFIPGRAGINHLFIDRSAFYAAISSDNVSSIDTQLDNLKAGSGNEKDAFEGALLMKKAGLVAKTSEKMRLFKAGRTKLENAIKKDTDNTEFHFLRLLIQENAPKIVNYRDNLEADIAFVKSNYKALPPPVQQVIVDYSKKSKALKL